MDHWAQKAGLRGIPGTTGDPGTEGVKGEVGSPGYSGALGAEGPAGPKGEKGERGNNGTAGLPGDKGEKGSKGAPGLSGFRGPIGQPGQVGPPGALGPAGPRGDSGSKGERGKRGKALPCPRGTPGIPGSKGDMGMDGPEGLKGDKGEPGLSEEDVKDLVRREMSDKCACAAAPQRRTNDQAPPGRDFQLVIKSSNPDEAFEDDDHTDQPVTEASEDILVEKEIEEETWNETLPTTQPPTFTPIQNTTDGSNKELMELMQRRKRQEKSLFPDPCALPMDEGSCSRYALLWYYHVEADDCRPFVFGGCGGNGNRFKSRQKCERRCKTSKEPSMGS